MRGMEEIHKLLSGEGRTLKNIKFFPGNDRGLTSEQLAHEAQVMLEAALASGRDAPPVSGVEAIDLAAL